MWKTALKPQWIAGFVFAIVVSGVFVLLSQWQFGRSTTPEIPVNPATEDVRPLTGTLDPGSFFPGSVADQMVAATGEYDPAKQVLVAERLKDGAKGYWVVDAFKVDGAPALEGVAASPETWIPVARGWVADPEAAPAPPSGIITLTGRLLPSEAPLANVDPQPGWASAVSAAELINQWNVSSYPAFIAATSEMAGGADVSAAAVESPLEPLEIGPQPPGQKVNWLNLFYSLEWVVFAGFALFIWWRLVRDDYNRDREEELDENFEDHHSEVTR
ncbi:SURF1 family cytochrome oxidase biogenesis protein [Pseudarthrobacter sp. J75]|uniref:SURF1 family protein n=1 Tax=unclassified Pseudarthrobacter TaxID=2647000 RepID=UPI002E8153BB|nr:MULTISPECIES: SURF1 family cytochrome oxidase biogenesis protein [unclassified Pseudarthrobacter]MEE2521239.1 SURF1 family cytochrome oxidase biogenesis protein [Pseudarthrobacter sp. J47]MEE2528471.1 SURF1 family cytochrome oxidase biogenesis protein [Pseudarthrobacter sp. J75]MEE2568161.1 SURF1 family cytochrome oxidase biogenesis protein [Pseudarthrobacter sp. J64]